MMILPSPPRRAWLMSFWFVISLSSGFLLGALSRLLGSPLWFLMGMILAMLLAALGLIRPAIVRVSYRVWNDLARFYSRAAGLLLKGICFYGIFVPAGWVGSSLLITRPISSRSLWMPRQTHEPTKYTSQYDALDEDYPHRGWISTLLLWARRSGNIWALFVLPSLILLSALQLDEESSSPSGIYTLF